MDSGLSATRSPGMTRVMSEAHILIRSLTEQAARAQREHQQDRQESDGAAVVRREKQERQLLADANGERSDDRARNAAKPADDRRREDRQDGAKAGERIDRGVEADEHAAEAG